MRAKIFALLLGFAVATPMTGATIGQIDTFGDGTAMGWFVPGSGAIQPKNIGSRGPDGLGDAYLQLQSSGIPGLSGRLSLSNDTQWAGNYLEAGITGIRMDVNNLGASGMYLRLLFEDFEGTWRPANIAISALEVFVPAGSGWMTVDFGISPSHFLAGGIGTVEGALMSTDVIRILFDPSLNGPVTLGVDNLTATVPELGTIALMVFGVLGLVAVRITVLQDQIG